MKILGSINDVLRLKEDLISFISAACPWINDDWNPEQIGYIFVLEEDDLEYARSLQISPHTEDSMTIDLEVFDMWEGEAIHDSGYWNVVGIVGQEYGFVLFVSDALAEKLPNFYRYLKGGQS